MGSEAVHERRSTGGRRRLGTAVRALVAIMGVGAVAFLAWALDTAPYEPRAYAAAVADPHVVLESRSGFITLRPAAHAPTVGLLFYPGARVAPEAYVAKLSAVAAAANVQVVIGRPPLNLAFFAIDQADAMRAAVPGVTRWFVGGHSLGGAMACLYASRHPASVEGVVLLGTYCGSDLSRTSLRVLSVSGERDGLFPPEKIAAARAELPPHARMVQVAGMNHAQLGNYGEQPGDLAPLVGEDAVRRALVEATTAFFMEREARR